nr:MAG TPA: hypothetical protein [Bacteriophage sp.]
MSLNSGLLKSSFLTNLIGEKPNLFWKNSEIV